MSSYRVLKGVSETLRATLWEAIQAEPELTQFVANESGIVFSNPTQAIADVAKNPALSMWLYKVDEDQYTRNSPEVRSADGSKRLGHALPLVLSYLLTPLRDEGADLMLLGKSMEALHRSAILPSNADQGVFEDLRISLHRRSLEELTRVWEALRESYRLSVCYQVRVTQIVGDDPSGNAIVRDRVIGGGE